MSATGGSITKLTGKLANNNFEPTWSPQGDQIVFTHSKGAQFRAQETYSMNADGTGITSITHTNDETFGPDWGSG